MGATHHAHHEAHEPTRRSRLILYILLAMAAGLIAGYILNQHYAGIPTDQLDKKLQPFSWDPLESTCRHASLSIL